MTIRITHAKVSGKAAGTDSTRVYGTHWDAYHTVVGAADLAADNAFTARQTIGPNSGTLVHPPILGNGSRMTIASDTGDNTFINAASYGTLNLPGWIVLKARGTQAAPTAAKKDDILGIFSALPYGTTSFGLGGGQVLFAATADCTDTVQGGRCDIQVSPEDFVATYGGIPDVVTVARFDQDGTQTLGPNVATISNPVTTLISPIGAVFKAAMRTNVNTFSDLFSFGTCLPGYVTHAARGTQDAPTALQAGDYLGITQFGGRDSSTTWSANGGAQMRGVTSQIWQIGRHGAYLAFLTTPDNADAEVESFRATPLGGLAVGLTTDTTAGVVNVSVGFRQGTMTAGRVLRSDGANFVSAQLGVSDLGGAGTGVLAALAVNVGSAGAPVTFNGALGTPSSGVGTNLTGTASGLTAGDVANAPVIAKVLTGYTSGAGTVSATDSILAAIQKLNGNDALALPKAGGTMSGAIAMGGNNISGANTIAANTSVSAPLITVNGGVIGLIAFNLPAANFNSTADQAIAIALPTGYTRYRIQNIFVSNPSISMTTAVGGIYTAPAKGGIAMVAAAQAYSALTNNTAGTNGSLLNLPVANSASAFYNSATIYLSLTTPQGAAATADITIVISPLP